MSLLCPPAFVETAIRGSGASPAVASLAAADGQRAGELEARVGRIEELLGH